MWRWASLSQRQHGMEGCGGEQWGQSAASLCDEAVLGSPRSSCLRASASAGSRVLCPLGLSWDAVGPCLACVPTPWRGRRCCPSVSSLAWTTAAYAWKEPGDSKVGGGPAPRVIVMPGPTSASTAPPPHPRGPRAGAGRPQARPHRVCGAASRSLTSARGPRGGSRPGPRSCGSGGRADADAAQGGDGHARAAA